MAATPIPANRATFTAEEVVKATAARHVGGAGPFAGVITDSREIEGGELYVALVGERHDGHDFVEAAVSAGASAVLVSREVEVPSAVARFVVDDTLTALGALASAHRAKKRARVVAVTGSVGKTSTKELLKAALEGAGLSTLATVGNLNNRIGVPATLLTLEDEHDAAVIELGMNEPGEIADLAAMCRPEVALVTAVAPVHTEGVSGLSGVAREKGAVYAALGEGGVAIHNIDDELLAPYIEASPARAVSFGASEGATVRLVSHELRGAEGTDAVVAVRGTRHALSLKLLGRAAAQNATAALAVVDAMMPDRVADAARALGEVSPPPHRMNAHPHPSGILLIDDAYNASPRSVEAALETCAQLARDRGGRLVAVLADMLELGADEVRLHQEVGRAAIRHGARCVIACGERMSHAGRAALSATMENPSSQRAKVILLRDPMDAPACVIEVAQPHDVVLIKGSQSMGMEAVVEALRAPFELGRAEADEDDDDDMEEDE